MEVRIPYQSSLPLLVFEFSKLIKQLGGEVMNSVSAKLDYLIIGADANPCWAYTCYGRKVEKAVELRKSGARLILVHENDFHDAVADNRFQATSAPPRLNRDDRRRNPWRYIPVDQLHGRRPPRVADSTFTQDA